MYLEHDYFKVGLALLILNRTGDIYESILVAEKTVRKIRFPKYSE